jgi:hypothetical protein
MYRNSGVYDDKHRMNTFDIEDILKNRKIRKEQTGVNNGDILCANCDNVIISNYEKYAAMAIYGKDIPIESCLDWHCLWRYKSHFFYLYKCRLHKIQAFFIIDSLQSKYF